MAVVVGFSNNLTLLGHRPASLVIAWPLRIPKALTKERRKETAPLSAQRQKKHKQRKTKEKAFATRIRELVEREGIMSNVSVFSMNII